MNNSNNMWLGLARPPVSRPGDSHNTPVGRAAQVCRTPNAAAKRDKRDHIVPIETTAVAHEADLPWGVTPTMMSILELMVQGLNSTQVARTLNKSKSTISKYTIEMRHRMKVETNAQAVVAWHRHYRVLQPDLALGAKDATLISNLRVATEALRALNRNAA